MRRKSRSASLPAPGEELPARESAMSARAAQIAISEISDVPTADLCGWAMVVSRHVDGGHDIGVFCQGNDFDSAAKLIAMALADLRAGGS